MSERVNVKVRPETRDALREHKRDGETWDDLLERLADPTVTLEYGSGGEGMTEERTLEPGDSVGLVLQGTANVHVRFD